MNLHKSICINYEIRLGGQPHARISEQGTHTCTCRWYRAPECLLTDGYYNYKMDMWGVGCVFFEIVSLFPLFPGTNELDQIQKIHSILGTPPPELLAKMKKRSAHMDFNFPPKVCVRVHDCSGMCHPTLMWGVALVGSDSHCPKETSMRPSMMMLLRPKSLTASVSTGLMEKGPGCTVDNAMLSCLPSRARKGFQVPGEASSAAWQCWKTAGKGERSRVYGEAKGHEQDNTIGPQVCTTPPYSLNWSWGGKNHTSEIVHPTSSRGWDGQAWCTDTSTPGALIHPAGTSVPGALIHPRLVHSYIHGSVSFCVHPHGPSHALNHFNLLTI
eukprot:441198-Pelagomonas_calceolata.AAC.5